MAVLLQAEKALLTAEPVGRVIPGMPATAVLEAAAALTAAASAAAAAAVIPVARAAAHAMPVVVAAPTTGVPASQTAQASDRAMARFLFPGRQAERHVLPLREPR